jgi:hypothetical protein
LAGLGVETGYEPGFRRRREKSLEKKKISGVNGMILKVVSPEKMAILTQNTKITRQKWVIALSFKKGVKTLFTNFLNLKSFQSLETKQFRGQR